MIPLSYRKWLWSVTLLFVTLYTHLYRLGLDFVHNDAFHIKYWSFEFWDRFIHLHFDKLFLIIQPAVLTVWFNILGWKILNLFIKVGVIPSITGKEYELYLHIFQKIPQSVFIVLLTFIIYFFIKQVFNSKFAFWVTLIITIEPFLIYTTRIIQSDGVLAYLYFLSSIFFVKYLIDLKNIKNIFSISRHSKIILALSGFFGGLAFIEKSTAFLLIPSVLILSTIFGWIKTKNIKGTLNIISSCFLYFIPTFFITAFVMYPSFWGEPLYTLKRMTYDVFILGIKGLEVENFDYTITPHIHSYFYYFLTLLIRSSPWLKAGLIILVINYKKFLKNRFLLFLLIFPIIYFSIHELGNKKIDRYMSTVFIYLAFYSGIGYYYFYEFLSKIKKYKVKFIFNFIFLTYVFIAMFFLSVNYPAYYDPIFKSVVLKNDYIYDDLSSLSGYIETAEYLKKKYGANLKVASSDYKMLYLYYPGEVTEESPIYRPKPDYVLNGCNYRQGEAHYTKEKDIFVNGLCVKTLYKFN